MLKPEGNPIPVGGEWVPTLQEEFDSSQLDRSVWSDQYYFGRTHNYDAYCPSENVSIIKSKLNIFAREEKCQGKAHARGVISSHGEFEQTFDYFDGCFRIPAGQGL
jgi:hypothetical protein